MLIGKHNALVQPGFPGYIEACEERERQITQRSGTVKKYAAQAQAKPPGFLRRALFQISCQEMPLGLYNHGM